MNHHKVNFLDSYAEVTKFQVQSFICCGHGTLKYPAELLGCGNCLLFFLSLHLQVTLTFRVNYHLKMIFLITKPEIIRYVISKVLEMPFLKLPFRQIFASFSQFYIFILIIFRDTSHSKYELFALEKASLSFPSTLTITRICCQLLKDIM